MGKAAATSRTLPGVKTVRLVHWRAAEAGPLIEAIQAGGFTVDYPGERALGNMRDLRELQPHAVVIDLTRMPSHGRYVAAGIRQTKSIRHIPIVFVEGDPEKVKLIRESLPDAVYTTRAKLLGALKKVKPLTAPVAPPGMMSSYGQRATWQKLGIKDGMRVGVHDPPLGYTKIIGALPDAAQLIEEPDEALPLTLWFVRDPDTYLMRLREMRKIAGKSRLWVMYPKGSKSPLTQFTVREGAMQVGLVDYKICSLDETWTGMLFALKK